MRAPRDAASLVIVRGEGSRARVLLGRRPTRDRFMPDVYVFPGGRVDRADARAAVHADLAPGVARPLAATRVRAQPRALAVAAVRETYEETGLLFGRADASSPLFDLSPLEYLGRAITPASSPIRYHARFFFARAEAARGRLRGNGELLDLRWLPLAKARELPMIDVTQRMLEEAAARLGVARSPRPLFIHYRGARRIETRDR
ncbi:MAG: NUDIX hydrolase [Proteobacteria bacterium]|nr:NUDIX hydrolase [Pseudomonadota bacterium]